MRRVSGESTGRGRVVSSTEVLLFAMRQGLQEIGHPEEASETSLRERQRLGTFGQSDLLN